MAESLEHHQQPHWTPSSQTKDTGRQLQICSQEDCRKKLVRLITGHNRLKTRMHKLKLTDSPNCDCTLDRQTAKHILMSWSLHTAQWNKLIDKIERIYTAESTPHHQRILTANTLMHPRGPAALRQQIAGAVMMFLLATDIQLWLQLWHLQRGIQYWYFWYTLQHSDHVLTYKMIHLDNHHHHHYE